MSGVCVCVCFRAFARICACLRVRAYVCACFYVRVCACGCACVRARLCVPDVEKNDSGESAALSRRMPCAERLFQKV